MKLSITNIKKFFTESKKTAQNENKRREMFDTHKGLTEKYFQLIVNTIDEALEQQIKQAETSVDKFLRTKILKKEKYKSNLMFVIRQLYLNHVSLRLLHLYEDRFNCKLTTNLDKYTKKPDYEIDSDSDSEENDEWGKLVEKYFEKKFEQSKNFITLRERYLINLINNSVTQFGLQTGLLTQVLNEALGITTHFCDGSNNILNTESIKIKHSIDFSKVMTLFKQRYQKELTPEAQKIIDVLTDLTDVIDEYKKYKVAVSYAGNKNQEIQIARAGLEKINNIKSLNILFAYSKMYINKHRNFFRDYIFGLNNTKSWQMVAQEIRKKAYECLLKEVSEISDPNEKIKYLRDAKKLTVFMEHRHNYVVTGAFFRTRTVKNIDKAIHDLEKQKGKTKEHTPPLLKLHH